MTFMVVALALALASLQPTPIAADATAVISGDTIVVSATITNPSMYDLYIVSGTSESAASVTLMDGDKAITSLTVPAYGSVELKPGGQHLRLSGLKGQLKEGDELKLNLDTDGGAGIPVAAIVKSSHR